MYEIEHGVAMPGRRHKYPFPELEVGDSFFVPFKDPSSRDETVRLAVTIGSSACHCGKKLGRKFATRTVEGGLRAWRIS